MTLLIVPDICDECSTEVPRKMIATEMGTYLLQIVWCPDCGEELPSTTGVRS